MEEDSDQHSGARIGSNEDLLTEVLIRLPVTSILRFKSVCKHWRLLLTHKHFTHRFDINFSKSPGLFGQTDFTLQYQNPLNTIYVPFGVENRSTPPLASLDLYFNRFGVKIRQSCNGLLLCYVKHNRAHEYYVFNPTTKQLAFIPLPLLPEGKSAIETICSMALAFHQTDCVHFKVVCICALESRDLFQIQVYSSDTRSWKICIKSFSGHDADFYNPVYWNGAVLWVPYGKSNGLMCFKLDVEQLQMLPVPEGLSDKILTYFGESRGHLHLISHTKHEEDIFRVNVYEMLGDYSGWFVKYRLQLDALLGDFHDMIFRSQGNNNFGSSFSSYRFEFQVVDVVRGKEEEGEESFLVLVTPLKIIRYNVHDKSLKELYRYKECSYESASVHRYIETLSSL